MKLLLKSPIKVHIFLTQRCNLQCIHCLTDSSPYKITTELHLNDIRKIAKDLSKYGVPHVIFDGGEPFIRRDIIEIIEVFIREKIPSIHISTNGTLISEELASRLAEVGLRKIQVSIDSSFEQVHDYIRGKGVFKKATQAVKILSEYGIKVKIASLLFYVPGRETFEKILADVEGLINLAVKLNAEGIDFKGLAFFGRASRLWHADLKPHEWLKLIEYLLVRRLEYKGVLDITFDPYSLFMIFVDSILRKLVELGIDVVYTPCGAGTIEMSILADGTAIPCSFLPRIFNCGNIRSEPFDRIWYRCQRIALRLLRGNNYEPCKSCKLWSICRGGCKALAYQHWGTVYGPDPRCPYAKVFKS